MVTKTELKHEFAILITPKKAQQFLDTMGKNRIVSRGQVDKLTAAIERGQWILNHDPIIFDWHGCMRNGQHRCKAVIRTDKSIPCDIVWGANPKAFLTMDVSIKTRSAADIFSIAGKTNCALTAAMAKWLWLFQHKAIVPGGRSNAMIALPTHKELLDWANEQLKTDDSIHIVYNVQNIIHKSVASSLHYLFAKKDKIAADKFFICLATGADMATTNPILILRNYLIKDARKAKGRLPATFKAVAIIKAWNLWRQNKTTISFKSLSWMRSNGKGKKSEPFPYEIM